MEFRARVGTKEKKKQNRTEQNRKFAVREREREQTSGSNVRTLVIGINAVINGRLWSLMVAHGRLWPLMAKGRPFNHRPKARSGSQ